MFRLPDRFQGVPGEFAYQRCHDCRTVFQDPRVVLEDLSLCYPDGYLTHQVSNDVQLPSAGITTLPPAPSLRARLRQAVIATVRQEATIGVMGWLGKLLAKSRHLRERAFYSCVVDEMLPFKSGGGCALEVGCGAGQLLRSLTRIGWQVEGLEWDERAAENARRTSGQQVRVGDFQDVSLPPQAYDLVVLNHVLEHLPDTLDGLRKISEILAPGGRAVLIYPNPDSLGARVFYENWLAWDPPRHLVLPPVRVLAEAAKNVGLDSLQTRSSARAAEWCISISRNYKSGRLFDSSSTKINLSDRLFVLLERALIGIGLELGEELIVVLEKPRFPNPNQGKESAEATSQAHQLT